MNAITQLPSGPPGEAVLPGPPGEAVLPRLAREKHGAALPGSRVVVGIDDTPAGLAALGWAMRQARSAEEPLVAVRSWTLGLPRHGGRRRRRPARAHPHVILAFDGTEQQGACAELVRRSFRAVAGGVPRDITVTIRTPEGDPAAVLADIASSPRDLLVVGREPALSLRRLLHGSVGCYLRGHATCPVVMVPAAGDLDREEAP